MNKLIRIIQASVLFLILSAFAAENLLCKTVYAADKNLKEQKNKSASKSKKTSKPAKESSKQPKKNQKSAKESAKPAKKPAKSSKQTQKRVEKPAKTVKKTTKPTKESEKAIAEPAKPIKNPTKLVEKPAKSVEDAVKLATKPKMPIKEPTKLLGKVTDQIKEVAKLLGKPAKPIKQPKESAKPLKKVTKPVEKPIKSVNDPTKPLKEPEKPLKKHQKLIKPEMVAITGGCFQTGNPESEPEKETAEKQHQICVKDFEIGKYELTQSQWQGVMEDNPSHFIGDNLPVDSVSLKDVEKFIEKLNAKTGKHYRLPSEDEWFFACQAGSSTEYCGSDSIEAVAWYYDNSEDTTHPVGKKAANAWGLYDMSGNVMEWASSCVEANCSGRVLRGGSWRGSGNNARFVIRFNDVANYRFNSIGFRLAQDLNKPLSAQ